MICRKLRDYFAPALIPALVPEESYRQGGPEACREFRIAVIELEGFPFAIRINLSVQPGAATQREQQSPGLVSRAMC